MMYIRFYPYLSRVIGLDIYNPIQDPFKIDFFNIFGTTLIQQAPGVMIAKVGAVRMCKCSWLFVVDYLSRFSKEWLKLYYIYNVYIYIVPFLNLKENHVFVCVLSNYGYYGGLIRTPTFIV